MCKRLIYAVVFAVGYFGWVAPAQGQAEGAHTSSSESTFKELCGAGATATWNMRQRSLSGIQELYDEHLGVKKELRQTQQTQEQSESVLKCNLSPEARRLHVDLVSQCKSYTARLEKDEARVQSAYRDAVARSVEDMRDEIEDMRRYFVRPALWRSAAFAGANKILSEVDATSLEAHRGLEQASQYLCVAEAPDEKSADEIKKYFGWGRSVQVEDVKRLHEQTTQRPHSKFWDVPDVFRLVSYGALGVCGISALYGLFKMGPVAKNWIMTQWRGKKDEKKKGAKVYEQVVVTEVLEDEESGNKPDTVVSVEA